MEIQKEAEDSRDMRRGMIKSIDTVTQVFSDVSFYLFLQCCGFFAGLFCGVYPRKDRRAAATRLKPFRGPALALLDTKYLCGHSNKSQ